jgi:hypothetical protein
MMTILYIIISAICGFAVGCVLSFIFRKRRADGRFVINHSDPTKDLCTLELESDLDVIERNKLMTLEVVIHDVETN